MNIIDVRQLVTQILGFLIVIWLMGRYAWPKVLGYVEARREGIAADLRDAEARKREAGELKDKLDRELRGIETRARARIQEAVGEGQQVASEIRANAQRDVTSRMQRLATELEHEREKAMVTLKQDVVRLSVGAAEKILREKLDEKASRRLVEEFIDEASGDRAAGAGRSA